MLDIQNFLWSKKYENIFLIASFHHLETLKERESMMRSLYESCESWGKIYMTNWALNSDFNKEKYWSSEIINSHNNFWSTDYSIKIWKFNRFYHCFNISELEYLAQKSEFKVLENRLFDNEKNIITILQK
jgi:hypothetical protein